MFLPSCTVSKVKEPIFTLGCRNFEPTEGLIFNAPHPHAANSGPVDAIQSIRSGQSLAFDSEGGISTPPWSISAFIPNFNPLSFGNMKDVTPVISGLTVGAYFDAMLYMLEIIQLISYIHHYWRRDRILIKVVVILCFLADTLCTLSILVWVMMVDVVHWGDLPYLDMQYWPTFAYVFCTVIVGALVQSFLISRYYALTSSRLVSFILGSIMLTGLGGGLSVGIILTASPLYADRDKALVASSIWSISSCIVDILIVIFLVLALSRASTGPMIRNTKTLISRLILIAIQSGTVTTVLAFLVLTTYIIDPTSNNPAYFSFCLGRAYTLTMLFNLNIRRSLDNRCHSCGMNTMGISVVGDAVTGAADGGTGVIKSKDTSEDLYHLPASQVYRAELPSLRLDRRDQLSLEGGHRYSKSSEADRTLGSPSTT